MTLTQHLRALFHHCRVSGMLKRECMIKCLLGHLVVAGYVKGAVYRVATTDGMLRVHH